MQYLHILLGSWLVSFFLSCSPTLKKPLASDTSNVGVIKTTSLDQGIADLENDNWPKTLRQHTIWPRMESEQDSDSVIWVPTKTGATNPRLAFDGTQWLIVWQDFRSGVWGVYGMRVREDGTVLDPIGFPISVRSTPSSAPVVAFSGSHFLVAWIDVRNQISDIYAARVDSQGRVLDPQGIPLLVSSYPKGSLALASNGQDVMLAFAYSLLSYPGLYVMPVSDNGVALAPPALLAPVNRVAFPEMAWTGTHYLLTYSEETSGYHVSAARILADGTILDPGGFHVAWFNNTISFYSSVASDGINSLIPYYYSYYYTGNQIRAVRVSESGELLDSPHLQLSFEYSPRVNTWISTSTTFVSDRYLVAWYDYHDSSDPNIRNPTADLYANVVFSDGVSLYSQGTTLLAEPGHQFTPRLVSGNTGALMVFGDFARSVNDVRALRLDENADVIGSPFYVNVSGNAQYYPKLAAGVDLNGNFQMLAFWQDQRGDDFDVYAARLNAQGVTQDATALPVSTAPGHQIPGSVTFSGGRYWAIFTDESTGDRDIYVARITPEGTMLDPEGVLVAGGEGDQDEPVMVADGQGGVWIAFTDRVTSQSRVQIIAANPDVSIRLQAVLSDPMRMAENPALVAGDFGIMAVWSSFLNGTMQVEAALLAWDGTLQWGPMAIDAYAGSIQRRPTVAFDGDRFYIAWEDNRNLYYQIRGAVVSLNGIVTPSQELASSSTGQYSPYALFDGLRFVVVWEEQSDTVSDIRLARVNENATPVDVTFVTQSSVSERAPMAVVERARTIWLAYSRVLSDFPYGASRVRLRHLYLNHPPTVPEYTVTTVENTPVELTVVAEDEDDDELIYTVVQDPSFGILTGDALHWVYVPNNGFSGEDTFVFRVDDGYDVVERQVKIRVLPQTQRPTAQSSFVVTQEDTPISIVLQALAPSGQGLTYVFEQLPRHGMLKGTPPDLIYNPDADYFGPDFFSFRVSDGVLVSDVAIVSIEVVPVNDPPVVFDQDLQTQANKPLWMVLHAKDVDGDTLAFEITQVPSHGTLQGTPPFLQYIPHKNYYGSDVLQFSVFDGQSVSTSEIRIAVENTLRRKLDGDASVWGCNMATTQKHSTVNWLLMMLVGVILGTLHILRKSKNPN